jgi:hypothetical protein
MFSFFHRTPVIHLDCFTNAYHAYKFTPIVKASKAIPQWWRNTAPGTTDFDFVTFQHPTRNRNVRTCYGFIELYKRGCIVESWSDFVLKNVDGKCTAFYSTGPQVSTQTLNERGGSFRDYTHLKLVNPWRFKEKTGVQFHCSAAWWSLEGKNFIMPPGLLAFDFNNAAHVNILVPKKAEAQQIRLGQPLMHLIPLIEGRLEIKNHFIDREDIDREFYSLKSFYGWRAIKNLMNRNKERERCPFKG